MNRWSAVVSFAVSALVAGCGDGGGPAGEGRIRVVHAVPDAPDLDVLLDDSEVESNVAYLIATDYQDVPAGIRNVTLNAAGTATTLVSVEITVADGSAHTVIAGGLLAQIQPMVLEDDDTAPAAGTAKVRLVHGGPTTQALDIYVTASGADLAAETPLLANLAFGDVTEYVELSAATLHQIRATLAGTKTVVLDGGLHGFVEDDGLTIMVAEVSGDGAPSLTLVGWLDRTFTTPLRGLGSEAAHD